MRKVAKSQLLSLSLPINQTNQSNLAVAPSFRIQVTESDINEWTENKEKRIANHEILMRAYLHRCNVLSAVLRYETLAP